MLQITVYCILYHVYIFCLHTVLIILDPPASNATGVQSFDYCPTGSVSVNVMCEVKGSCISGYNITPQVAIGTDVFILRNGTKWGITAFSKNSTFLHFELPLNAATSGLAVRCQIQPCLSSNITLQPGIIFLLVMSCQWHHMCIHNVWYLPVLSVIYMK